MRICVYSEMMDELGNEVTEASFNKFLSKIREDLDIEELYLRGASLTQKQFSLLSGAISSNKFIRVLDISANREICNKESSETLKKIILEHPLLKDIRLDFNNISDAFIQTLLEHRSKNYVEQVLTINFDLSSNNLTDEILPFIENRLSKSSILSVFNGNRIEDLDLIDKYYKKEAKDSSSAKLR